MTILNSGAFNRKIEIYEQQLTPAYKVTDDEHIGYVKVLPSESDADTSYVEENIKIYNDINFTTQIGTSNGENYYYVSLDAETDELGEIQHNYIKIKDIFARIETRIGGLLTGRPADTVLSTVTHKFSWRYSSMPVVLPNKHKIKYRDNWFNVNYCLNDGFKDEVLEVFVTEDIG